MSRISESGVMPLASEIAEEKARLAPKEEADAPETTSMISVIDEAISKLTEQGLTREEAVAVVERRIRG